MAAPVCHVPSGPSDPNTPTINLTNIPVAQPNLQSLTNVVNALRAALQTMTNQNERDNGTGTQNNFKTNDRKKVQWTEQSRRVEKVRVFQNDDKTSDNWIDIERINQLVMVDKKTGQTWTWNRKR